MATRRARLRVAPKISVRPTDSLRPKPDQNESKEKEKEATTEVPRETEKIITEVTKITPKQTDHEENHEEVDNTKKTTEPELNISNITNNINSTINNDISDSLNDKNISEEFVSPRDKTEKKIPETSDTNVSPTKTRSRFTKVRPNIEASRRFSSKNSNNTPEEVPRKLPIQRLVAPSDFPPDPEVVNKNNEAVKVVKSVVDEVNSVQKEVEVISDQSSSLNLEKAVAKKLAKSKPNVSSKLSENRSNEVVNKKKNVPRRNFNSVMQKPPEKDRMTMFDLIYWNPAINPSQIRNNETANRLNEEEVIGLIEDEENVEEVVEPSEDSNSGDAMPVPQVKVGADGSIIVDEKSLIVPTTAAKKGLDRSPITYENSSVATYSSFKKAKNGRYWDAEETKKFYKVLNTVGTDFSMMTKFFPSRTRHELKLKFNREDRINKNLIDKAISEPQQFDFCVLEEMIAEEENNIAQKTAKKNATRSKRGRGKTKTTRRTKKRKVEYLSEDEDEVQSDVESVEVSPDAELIASTLSDDDDKANTSDIDYDDNDDSNMTWSSINRPTRSGRQPKRPLTFDASVEPKNKSNVSKVSSTIVSPLVDVLRQAVKSPISKPTEGSLVFVPDPKDSNTQVIHIYKISPVSQTFSVIANSQDKSGQNLVLPFTSPINPGQQIIINPMQITPTD